MHIYIYYDFLIIFAVLKIERGKTNDRIYPKRKIISCIKETASGQNAFRMLHTDGNC